MGVASLPAEPRTERNGLVPADTAGRLAGVAAGRVGPERGWRGAGGPPIGVVVGRCHRASGHSERVNPDVVTGPRIRQAIVLAHPEPASGDLDELHGTWA